MVSVTPNESISAKQKQSQAKALAQKLSSINTNMHEVYKTLKSYTTALETRKKGEVKGTIPEEQLESLRNIETSRLQGFLIEYIEDCIKYMKSGDIYNKLQALRLASNKLSSVTNSKEEIELLRVITQLTVDIIDTVEKEVKAVKFR